MIKKTLRTCTRCKLLWPRAIGQQMGPLPDFRVPTGSLSPFATTTLDAAGPIETRQGRGKVRAKRYLLILTCSVTRAVHIEMMYGLSADDFLTAFSRFVSERSMPHTIVCDNAGQFVKADKLINDDAETQLNREFPRIKFLFTPPRTPHVNGVTERMVQSMKVAMKHVMSNADLNDDELSTAAKKAQAILNSRPLSYLGSHPSELKPLTPADFLADKALRDLEIPDQRLDYRAKYRHLQTVLRDVWKRFQKEAIPRLNVVTKWLKEQDNLEEGDVVVVLDSEDVGKFPLGLVIQTYPGPDGKVRIVLVRINGRETRRHAAKLMLLVKSSSQ
jgi:hypothetical protein